LVDTIVAHSHDGLKTGSPDAYRALAAHHDKLRWAHGETKSVRHGQAQEVSVGHLSMPEQLFRGEALAFTKLTASGAKQ
jgi:hypothetical protein